MGWESQIDDMQKTFMGSIKAVRNTLLRDGREDVPANALQHAKDEIGKMFGSMKSQLSDLHKKGDTEKMADFISEVGRGLESELRKHAQVTGNQRYVKQWGSQVKKAISATRPGQKGQDSGGMSSLDMTKMVPNPNKKSPHKEIQLRTLQQNYPEKFEKFVKKRAVRVAYQRYKKATGN